MQIIKSKETNHFSFSFNFTLWDEYVDIIPFIRLCFLPYEKNKEIFFHFVWLMFSFYISYSFIGRKEFQILCELEEEEYEKKIQRESDIKNSIFLKVMEEDL